MQRTPRWQESGQKEFAQECASLLGSDYFAHYPTVAKESMAANLNMDEDLMLWPFEDVIAFGAEHSTLEGVMETAAKRMRMSLSPDPLPQEVVFIRSDQYSFVRQGVPAVFPVPGFKSSDPKIRRFRELGGNTLPPPGR